MGAPDVPRQERGVTVNVSTSPDGNSSFLISTVVVPPWGACATFTLQPVAKTHFNGLAGFDDFSVATATSYANTRHFGLPSAGGMYNFTVCAAPLSTLSSAPGRNCGLPITFRSSVRTNGCGSYFPSGMIQSAPILPPFPNSWHSNTTMSSKTRTM